MERARGFGKDGVKFGENAELASHIVSFGRDGAERRTTDDVFDATEAHAAGSHAATGPAAGATSTPEA